MPSKRKVRKQEKELEDSGWVRLTEDMWREQGKVVPKPKLLADANFPVPLVQRLHEDRIDVKTAQELKLEHLADSELLRRSGQIGQLLITMDDDFWSERKFPLHQSQGLIYVDSSKNTFAQSLGIELLAEFLKSFGGRWSRLKIRASADKLIFKARSPAGAKVEYEARFFSGQRSVRTRNLTYFPSSP